ncbi:MAG: hypothetical protein ACYDGR_02465 [Candidatus Dormibacteria bacterium]
MRQPNRPPGTEVQMLHETSTQIKELHEEWAVEMDSRYARRNKIRYIDRLLNELELHNLEDRTDMNLQLRRRLVTFLGSCKHPLGKRAARDLTVADTMEALYDIQDTLLVGSQEEDES